MGPPGRMAPWQVADSTHRAAPAHSAPFAELTLSRGIDLGQALARRLDIGLHRTAGEARPGTPAALPAGLLRTGQWQACGCPPNPLQLAQGPEMSRLDLGKTDLRSTRYGVIVFTLLPRPLCWPELQAVGGSLQHAPQRPVRGAYLRHAPYGFSGLHGTPSNRAWERLLGNQRRHSLSGGIQASEPVPPIAPGVPPDAARVA
jgi:hypothetical protein